jgi:hypothetical protein
MTDQPGTWVTPPVSYVEPLRLSCAFCGRPIARRYWSAAPNDESLVFCEPRHADLYVSYWLPTHGANAKERVDASAAE